MASLEEIGAQLVAEGKLSLDAPSSTTPPASRPAPAAHASAHAATKADTPQDTPPAKPDVKTKLATAGVMEQLHPNAGIAKLIANPAYLDVAHPDHQRVVAEVSAVFRGLYGEGDDPLNPSSPMLVDDLRRSFKLDFHPEASLPTDELREAWNTSDEGDFLAVARDWGLDNGTVQELYEFILDTTVFAGGPDKVDIQAATAEFNRRFEKSLTADQRRKLVAWYVSNAEDAAPAQ